MAIYNKINERKAPSNTKGPTVWIRENLFSTPLNVALTILGIMVLFWVIPPFVKWAYINANFAGTTREDCTSGGACWVFIRMKIDMFMYGFYPSELRWRINTVYGLFFVLMAAFKYLKSPLLKVALAHVYFIVGFLLVHGGFFGIEMVPTDKWGGLMLTIMVAAVGIVCAFPIGVLLALGRASHLPIIKSISVTYIEFIRGVPLITILFMSSIILPLFFPEGVTFDKLLRALIGIAMFEAAYIAENIRGGLQSIPKGQFEAADAIGLSYWQKMFLVILPQALKVAIPNLLSVAISLFQDTTLVLIIGLFDLLAMVRLSAADSYWLGYETEGYVFVTFIFWFFCYSMSTFSQKLEKRFNTNLR
ncbi:MULTISPECIES: amino acid ABC transporter permease [unclassified Sulfurospirillum]|uniref:amino acid ABC transporter permease n=1 Tax=unclassified Sulfurospirillum TaxID=2618290 RepID=UPI00050529F9|nr:MULTISPECIES: amino acid ABC transporter permease [unclassified Sulfurospirillum]KFL35226.1 amino acid ABC transporter permease [Sulfurospirillum sp. SCADC]